MIDVLSLITMGLAFFIVAVSPGPATISNATIAMSKGRKVSLVYSAGLSSGLFLWGIVASSGIGVILQGSIYLLTCLKIIGGLYLLRLAYLSFKSSLSVQSKIPPNEMKESSYRKWFLRGFILNSSNPKSIVAWMAALSVGVGANHDIFSLVIAVFTCMLIGFFVNAMYSFVFSIDGVMNVYQKIGRWVDRFVSGMFAVAGVGLIRSAFNRNPI